MGLRRGAPDAPLAAELAAEAAPDMKLAGRSRPGGVLSSGIGAGLKGILTRSTEPQRRSVMPRGWADTYLQSRPGEGRAFLPQFWGEIAAVPWSSHVSERQPAQQRLQELPSNRGERPEGFGASLVAAAPRSAPARCRPAPLMAERAGGPWHQCVPEMLTASGGAGALSQL